MKKGIYINQMIRNIIIIAILLWLFFYGNGLIKLIIIPFIICVVLSLIKYICLILGKNKYANIFNQLYAIVFLLFTFCFIIFWSYVVIKNNNYLNLLATIPFWLIWIYFIRKFFFKKNKKSLSKNKSMFPFEINVSTFLVLAVLVSGFLCLFIGIKDTYTLNKKIKNYVSTDGYFKYYSIYNSDEDGTTYKLTYEYEVDGKKYNVTTDYGVGSLPSLNSKRTVKYDPNNHENAVLTGMNRNNFLIYFGTFFVLGGMIFVLTYLQAKGAFDKIKINVMGTYVGIVFTMIGIGIILLQNGTSASITETIKTLGPLTLIPLVFIIVGIYLAITSVFSKEKRGN